MGRRIEPFEDVLPRRESTDAPPLDVPRDVSLGRVEDVPPGSVRIVPHAGPPPWRSIVVAHTASGVRAYWNVCSHLPVPLDGGEGALSCDEGQVLCNTHGARYRTDDGLCVAGPCEGARLRPLAVVESQGKLTARTAADGGPLSDRTKR